MNNVTLIGRLTKDPEIRQGNTAVANFTLAIDRPARQGEEKKTDFPKIVAFGKTAENCERFLVKGRLVGVQGRIQTGSYKDRDGRTVYTTDVIADRVEFLEWGDRPQENRNENRSYAAEQQDVNTYDDPVEDFQALDEAVPF